MAEPPKPEPPKPEPPKPPEAKQPPPTVQQNDNKEQEKIAEIAEQKAEAAKRAQDEKHRKQQIELDEQKKREEAEAEAKTIVRKSSMISALNAQGGEAEAIKLEKEKLAQLDDLQKQQSQVKHPPAADVPEATERKTGTNGTDTSLLAAYTSAIQKVVTENWNRPDTAAPGVRCVVRIIQIPGGTVINTTISSPCNADAVTQNSIIQAVTKAQPLPYKGYESVFQRDITFNFKYDGN